MEWNHKVQVSLQQHAHMQGNLRSPSTKEHRIRKQTKSGDAVRTRFLRLLPPPEKRQSVRPTPPQPEMRLLPGVTHRETVRNWPVPKRTARSRGGASNIAQVSLGWVSRSMAFSLLLSKLLGRLCLDDLCYYASQDGNRGSSNQQVLDVFSLDNLCYYRWNNFSTLAGIYRP